MLFISPLKAKIRAQMEGGGGGHCYDFIMREYTVHLCVCMTQVANVSLQLGEIEEKKHKRNQKENSEEDEGNLEGTRCRFSRGQVDTN